MFTGIIESIGSVTALQADGKNLHIYIRAPFTSELQVDQSIAHNGVCLTVVDINADVYRVTAIDETLQRSNLSGLESGSKVNLERAMVSGRRLDGHMVQGHVDQTARVTAITSEDGSWTFSFRFVGKPHFLLVEKGSITVDGVSLTVSGLSDSGFQVSIIPYTYEHTLFCDYREGSEVNIEFDVIGKYVHEYMQHYRGLADA